MLGIGAGFLARSSPEAVTARVRDYIAAGGPRGRLVLYCCDLSAATPTANVRAVIRAAREHGTYPLERKS